MLPLSDSALIARVLGADDRHAFGQLVLRHQSAVRLSLRRLTGGDMAWADDLAQETFVKAYRALAQYRGGDRLAPWLLRIAYNTFVSAARAQPVGADGGDLSTAEELEAAATEDVLLRADVERAMQCLSGAQRAALALTFGQDVSHEEAAAILKVPLGTLKTHVARAKARLRTELLAYQSGSGP